MPCRHPHCNSEASPYEPLPGAPVQFWCDEHAHEGGFCHRCGSFEAGHWEFETAPDHLCLECQRDLAREYAEEPEPEPEYPDPLDVY